jgi:choline dehydrogenase-like flavoprotein
MRLSSSLDELKPEYDAIVVGSGYGAGVAASRLARIGLKVAVLERGREFALGTFQVQCAVPVPAGCGNVTARFSAPGTYWLRVVAAERSATNAIVKVVVNP